jgi:hypothetical protein
MKVKINLSQEEIRDLISSINTTVEALILLDSVDFELRVLKHKLQRKLVNG